MHEAGIAAGILEIAQEQAAELGEIRAVGLRLGEFTGLDRDALAFAFEALAPGIRLAIEAVPLTGGCPDCLWTGPPEQSFCLTCPRCSSPVTILSGREMEVTFVDLELKHGTDTGRDQSTEEERRVCAV